jgi:diguanylate cyclase (GGDEF)-like protein
MKPVWFAKLLELKYLFQPIVNIHTGVSLGYEGWLRNPEALGFQTVSDLFQQAWQDGCLSALDQALLLGILHQLKELDWWGDAKVFCKLDPRLLDDSSGYLSALQQTVQAFQLTPDKVCLEVGGSVPGALDLASRLESLRRRGFKLVLNDCGDDFAGLRLLWSVEADFIKINRSFIRDLSTYMRKRTLLASVINIAHGMGCQVIAEGVETEKEYYICKDLGCDLVQGGLVQPPQPDLQGLRERYLLVLSLSENDRRRRSGNDLDLLRTWMEYIQPVDYGTDIFEIFQKFKDKKQRALFVVVNAQHEPLGILHENSFKEYAYSRFGNQLLQNPAMRENTGAFISQCPIMDIHATVESILEVYSQNDTIQGVLIVENMRYVGFLSAQSLLKVLYEKNLALARDQNPLTKLPGNNVIAEYVSRVLQDTQNQYLLVYFDFDHFKPYNDNYGFRNGDRVILLFAGILQDYHNRTAAFIGHIGGDDFFAGLKNAPLAENGEQVRQLAEKFRSDVESFYDPEVIQQGYLHAQNREGEYREFPLLSVSAVVLELKPGRKAITPAEMSRVMAEEKKAAKSGKDGHVRLISLGAEAADSLASETPGQA